MTYVRPRSRTAMPDHPALTARQIALTFAAEIEGMTVHGDVSPESLTQFVSFLHRYRVLVVPGDLISPAALTAFGRRFGKLELHARFENTLPAQREIFCVGNVVRDGATAAFSRGVEQWHSDSSYIETPGDASLFHAVIVPPEGGGTWFADATAAYRALDPAMRERIEDLRAVHSLKTLYDWNARQNPDQPPGSRANSYPAVSQRLVRVHPATGARSLYVCPAVISHVEGLEKAEGEDLIEALMAHASQPRFVYKHQWRAGDLVMWDNRAVLHTASLFDHTKYQRLMYRVTVAGGAPALRA